MKKILCLIIVLAAISASCSGDKYSDSLYAMGTIMTITVYGTPYSSAEKAVEEVFEYIKKLETITSAKLSDSEVGRINSGSSGQPAEISPELLEILQLAQKWSEITEGAFDSSLGNLTSLWKVDSDMPYLPSQPEIQTALEASGNDNIRISGNTLTLHENTRLDLGAIVKGYAADKAAAMLKNRGIESAMINLGGNICALGSKNGGDWKIYLTDPAEPSGFTAILRLTDKTVVTSGNYERYFEKNGKRYHHIFDRRTGYPAESGLISATVITDSSALGDILSTAFFVLGEEGAAMLKKKLDFPVDYILINEKGEHILSEGFSSGYEKLPIE